MNRLAKLAISLALPFSAGAIGSLATIPNIPIWYAALEKPFFNPPNWVFGPVWTLLYILIGISLYLVWASPAKKTKRTAYTLFGVQIALNTLWSVIFFGMHLPWVAVVVIVALLIAIVATIREFWHYSRLASYVLMPYVAWVSFATVLNISIALLN